MPARGIFVGGRHDSGLGFLSPLILGSFSANPEQRGIEGKVQLGAFRCDRRKKNQCLQQQEIKVCTQFNDQFRNPSMQSHELIFLSEGSDVAGWVRIKRRYQVQIRNRLGQFWGRALARVPGFHPSKARAWSEFHSSFQVRPLGRT